MEDLKQLQDDACQEIAASATLAELDSLRVKYLGKKGKITEQLKTLGKLPAEDRPAAGQKINDAKQSVSKVIEARKQVLQDEKLSLELAKQTIDVTLPGRGHEIGGIHPVTR
ncbi:MAG: phenylalanine--tRNA ligase subunit alpha, partial [Gammaproteobacteria bacterium]|nr:phenylalanine--tRNA ligase subunit alpha [Gammaproteobacteria bacterium]